MNKLIASISMLFLISCGNGAVENIKFREYGRVVSNIGHVAYVYEALSEGETPVTQVLVSFGGGACGAGVVSAYSNNLNFKLTWRDGSTLVIENPSGVELQWNPSGQYLKCGEYSIEAIVEQGGHA
ncbi:hypothetical protein ACJJIU_13235 [Microbulbifer sp. CnH-101-E]|uniref:hypothetical protein n=1 Tax=unclassified Microbulbifer TaxID=2619833 RepID=UPI00403A101D